MPLAPHPPPVAEGPAAPSRSRRLADAAGRITESWVLVAAVLAFPIAWVLLNMAVLIQSGARPFDPYPYGLLNLILSVLAAVQAPAIMISQRRQARTDRQRAEHDDQMNLKVELEIRALHQKVDAMRERELADIIAHQVELLQELRDRPRSSAA